MEGEGEKEEEDPFEADGEAPVYPAFSEEVREEGCQEGRCKAT